MTFYDKAKEHWNNHPKSDFRIIQNAVKHYGKFYVSTHQHDYVPLPNGEAIDGGCNYIRRIGQFGDYDEYIVTTEDDFDEAMLKLVWGHNGKNGTDKTKYEQIAYLETDHLNNILGYFNIDYLPFLLRPGFEEWALVAVAITLEKRIKRLSEHKRWDLTTPYSLEV